MNSLAKSFDEYCFKSENLGWNNLRINHSYYTQSILQHKQSIKSRIKQVYQERLQMINQQMELLIFDYEWNELQHNNHGYNYNELTFSCNNKICQDCYNEHYFEYQYRNINKENEKLIKPHLV